jgi:WD40 repeat protein
MQMSTPRRRSGRFSGTGVVLLVVWAPLATLAGQDPTASSPKVLEGHSETAYDVAFGGNGLMASASFDATIKLWRVADGALLATLSGHTGKVLAVAFSPDGSSLLSGGEDKLVKLWALPSSGPRELAGHGAAVRALALSPDGKWIATAAADGAVIVRERLGDKVIAKIEGLEGAARALAFAPGQRFLAAGLEDGSLRAWALPAPAPAAVAAAAGAAGDLIPAGESWRFHKGSSAPPAEWAKLEFDDSGWASGKSGFGYSSSAEELASVATRLDDMAGQYLSLYIRRAFDVDDPAAVTELSLRVIYDDGFVVYLNGDEVGRTNVEGSPPANTATAGNAVEPQETVLDLKGQLAKLKKGKNVLAIQGHNANTGSSDFVLSPVLRGASTKAPAPPPAESPPAGKEVLKVAGLGAPMAAVAVRADGGAIAGGSAKGAVVVHAAADGKEILKVESAGGAVGGIAFTDGGGIAAGFADGKVRLLGGDGKEIKALDAHEGAVSALAARSDGKVLATGGADGKVRLWNAADGNALHSIAGHQGPVLCLGFSADGKALASGSADKTLKVWKPEDGSAVTSFDAGAEVAAAGASDDGHFYSAGKGNVVLDWRLASSGELRSMQGHGGLVHAVAFSPDGTKAASGSIDKTVRIWNLADGKELRSINAHDASVYAVAFSPDGAMLASGGYDKAVKLWNVESGAEIKKLTGHEEGIFALAFSKDGKSVLSASSDHSLRVWNIESGMATHVLAGHPGWIMDFALVQDGARAVSADYGGHLITWDLAAGKEASRAKVNGTVHGFAVSSDGAWSATANTDGTLFVFRRPGAE